MSQNPLTSPPSNTNPGHQGGSQTARLVQMSAMILLVIGLLLLLIGMTAQLWGAADIGVLAVILAAAILVLSRNRLTA
jgi:hypothetical protein